MAGTGRVLFFAFSGAKAQLKKSLMVRLKPGPDTNQINKCDAVSPEINRASLAFRRLLPVSFWLRIVATQDQLGL